MRGPGGGTASPGAAAGEGTGSPSAAPGSRVGPAILTGLVFFLCFPHPLGGRVIDAGVGLAWLAPALLLWTLRDLPPRRAARLGFVTLWLAYAAILHWIYVVTVSYGHGHPAVGVVAPLLLALYIALFGGLFGGLWSWLGTRGLACAWSAAAVWTALDHGRSWLFSGFPWATLGYAQHQNPALLGLASFTGVYGLSFVSVLGGAAALELLRARAAGRRVAVSTWSAVAGVVALHGLGLAASAPEPAASVRTAVVQGNIEQGVKWSESWRERTLETYERLSREAAAAGAELVVWPETAVPGALELDAGAQRRLASLARETGAALVVGSVGVEVDARGRPVRYFDSAFVYHADGARGERFDKTHLVPFGEYIPFQDWLGRFLSAVARGIATASVTPGDAPRAVEVELADGRRLRLGVPVCYELLFPDLVRRFAAGGGGALLGITNDAWYGRTGAPHQFLAITALRAAETRLWVARAANTGVSAFIDASGAVREQTPIFEEAWRLHDLPLHPEPERASFYVRHGDVFAGLCWAGLALGLGWGALRGRMSEAPTAPLRANQSPEDD